MIERAQIGQLWAAHLHDTARGGAWPAKRPSGADFRGDSYETAFPLFVLVLDQYVSETLGKRVVNVVPFTREPRFAANWSLTFGAPDSGIGSPIVIHMDFEQSANIACLDRYVGRLPERSGSELLRVARAWSRSEAPPSDLTVGRLGDGQIRTRMEWQALDTWLSGMMRALYDTDLEPGDRLRAKRVIGIERNTHCGQTDYSGGSMPMARLSTHGRKLLQEMAQARGMTQEEVLDEALKTLKRKYLFEDANLAYAALRQDPAAWRALDEERQLLDGAMEDGISAG